MRIYYDGEHTLCDSNDIAFNQNFKKIWKYKVKHRKAFFNFMTMTFQYLTFVCRDNFTLSLDLTFIIEVPDSKKCWDLELWLVTQMGNLQWIQLLVGREKFKVLSLLVWKVLELARTLELLAGDNIAFFNMVFLELFSNCHDKDIFEKQECFVMCRKQEKKKQVEIWAMLWCLSDLKNPQNVSCQIIIMTEALENQARYLNFST